MEPFGEAVADQRFGELAALTANINRDSKKRPQPYAAAEFIHWRRKAKDQEPQKAATPEAQALLIKQSLFPKGAALAGKKKPSKK